MRGSADPEPSLPRYVLPQPAGATSALAAFAAISADHQLGRRAWRRTGGRVLGLVGFDAPRELALAAGLLPVRLGGGTRDGSEALQRLRGLGLDAGTARLLARLLDDDDPLDGLLIARDREAHSNLFAALRELERIGEAPHLPPTAFLDLLHLPYRSTAVYNRRRLAEVLAWLGDLVGRTITDEDLREAIHAAAAHRALLARALELRRTHPPRLTGTQALHIVAAAQEMDPALHTAWLRLLLDDADALPRHTGPRVFVSGSVHDDPRLYELLESTPTVDRVAPQPTAEAAQPPVIVGDDHDWGDRAVALRVEDTTDPRDGLVDAYHHADPGAARSSTAARAAYTARAALDSGAQLVLHIVYADDAAAGWDYPRTRDVLASHDIPAVRHGCAEDLSDAGQVAEALGTALAAQAADAADGGGADPGPAAEVRR